MAYKQRRPIIVSEGGTGQITLTNHGVLVGAATSAITQLSVGATNTVLLGNTGLDPSFGTVPNAALTNSSVTLNNGNNITVTGSPLSLGGTASFNLTGTTNHAVQIGNASGSLTSIVVGTTGQVLTGVTGADPVFAAPAASSISITGDTGGAIVGNSFTFAGGTTGLSFGGSGTTETLTFAGITANGGTVSLATDATTSTLNIGTGAGVKTTTLGSTNSTSTTTVQSGSGVLNVTATGGALTINSGTGALGLSTDASATTVSLATGGAVKTVTLGSTNSTSATTVQSGSGALTLTTNGGNANIVLTPNGTGVVTTANNLRAASISFDGGTNLLSQFVQTTSFTPTVVGATTAGTTNYSYQNGVYLRIGNIVIVNLVIQFSSATGTGDVLISNLPYTFNASFNGQGAAVVGGLTYPVGRTSTLIVGLGSTTTAKIYTGGSAVALAFLQMANTATTIIASLSYAI